MPTYKDLINVGGEIRTADQSKAFKDPTELAGYLGIDAKTIDWGQIAEYKPPTTPSPASSVTPQNTVGATQPVVPTQTTTPVIPQAPLPPPPITQSGLYQDETGTIWEVKDGFRRGITSEKAFQDFGFNLANVKKVQSSQLGGLDIRGYLGAGRTISETAPVGVEGAKAPSLIPEGENVAQTTAADRRDEIVAENKRLEEYYKQIEEQNRQIQDLQNQTLLQQLQAGLKTQTEVPVFADIYEAMRSKEGLPALEQSINSIDAEIAELDASQRKGEFREEGRMAPMGIIQGRQREIQRQGAEQRNDLLRKKAILVDQYQTSLNAINTMMQFQQIDFQNASDRYNQQFQQALQLQDALRASRAEERTEEALEVAEADKLREIAMANATVYMNNLAKAGISFDEASPEVQNALTKEIMKAGMDVNVVKAFMNTTPKAELLATYKGVDAGGKDIVTFLYADENGKPGSKEIVYTGGVSKTTGSGGGGGNSGNWINSETKEPVSDYEAAQTDLDTIVKENKNMSREELEKRMKDALNKGVSSGDYKLTSQQQKDLLAGVLPEEKEEQFLNREYFRGIYTMDQLKASAKKAGFTAGGFLGFGVGEEGVNDYLDYLMNFIEQYRKAGFTDKEILDKFPKE